MNFSLSAFGLTFVEIFDAGVTRLLPFSLSRKSSVSHKDFLTEVLFGGDDCNATSAFGVVGSNGVN